MQHLKIRFEYNDNCLYRLLLTGHGLLGALVGEGLGEFDPFNFGMPPENKGLPPIGGIPPPPLLLPLEPFGASITGALRSFVFAFFSFAPF